MIIWSFGNLIACTMTMASKHTSFPKLKKQTSPKVCPGERCIPTPDELPWDADVHEARPPNPKFCK